jgi:hypothetical protein
MFSLRRFSVEDRIKISADDVVRILAIDGGGAKGIIPAYLLKRIEEVVGKPIWQIFDLIVGSSVGSVIGGTLAAGKITAPDLYTKTYNALPDVFKKRWFRNYFVDPIYNRQPLVNILIENIGTIPMCQVKTDFMCTSVDLCDTMTHYFKSWESFDGQEILINTINFSYAAPLYFGAIVDSVTKSVWIDGGCANDNCPLKETIIECFRQDWMQDKKVHILSLGCGHINHSIPFEDARKFEVLRQILSFIDPTDGGLARCQSEEMNIAMAQTFTQIFSNFTFNRVSPLIDKKADIMDGVQYRDYYQQAAAGAESQIDYSKLR